MNRLRCAVLEDQRPAQEVIERYVMDSGSLDLVGVFSAPSEASAGLAATPTDILFLDLNLPRLDGFSFLRTLTQRPAVIVTTADPDQALEGFAHNVVDYLLKPFSFERFLQAVEKARLRNASAMSAAAHGQAEADPREIFIKCDGTFQRVVVEDILFIESDRDFLSLHTTQTRLHFAGTLQDILNRLPRDTFIRTHKSFVVNISRITQASTAELLVEGIAIPVGRSFKENLLQRLTRR